MKTYEEMKAEWNAKAKLLSEDGRAGRLWLERDGDRDAHTRDLVRWAFWQLSDEKRHETQANRDSTDEAFLMNALMTMVASARRDERERIVKPLIHGLRTLLGDELFAAVAVEMQWDD